MLLSGTIPLAELTENQYGNRTSSMFISSPVKTINLSYMKMIETLAYQNGFYAKQTYLKSGKQALELDIKVQMYHTSKKIKLFFRNIVPNVKVLRFT